MPPVGLALGAPLGRFDRSSADYVAIAVLVGCGLYTLLAPESNQAEGTANVLDRGPLAALVLGLSISIDELAIGSRSATPRVSGRGGHRYRRPSIRARAERLALTALGSRCSAKSS